MKRPLRVLSIVNDLPHGGDENRLLTYASSVDPRRVAHHIAVIKENDPAVVARYGSLRPDFVRRGIPLIELGVRRPRHAAGTDRLARLPQSAAAFARAIGKLMRIGREIGADVIDGHVGTGNQAAVVVGRALRTPVVVTTYHAELFTPRWLWSSVQQVTLRGASAIVTDSHQRANAIRRFLRDPARPIEIIVNGVATRAPQRPAAEVAAELGVPADGERVVIGQIAGLVPTKGWTQLLHAAARVLASEPRAFFLCIGPDRYDPAYRPQLHALAERLGIAGRIRIAAYPGDNADVWQLFDVHAHASLFDSLPNAIIEGMAYGRPAVVTDVGDCARTVVDGESGFVVPPGDPDALADALLRLVRDPALRARFGAQARSRYERFHRPETMTESITALFERVAR